MRNSFISFLVSLDDGVGSVFQRSFAAVERLGKPAAAIHRDLSCVILGGLAVFLALSFQFQNELGSAFLASFAATFLAVGVEMFWLKGHQFWVTRSQLPKHDILYETTAKRSRSTMLPFRLIAGLCLLVGPAISSSALDWVGWVLVLAYWVKFYALRCKPSRPDIAKLTDYQGRAA